jgi:hypothetical protein
MVKAPIPAFPQRWKEKETDSESPFEKGELKGDLK